MQNDLRDDSDRSAQIWLVGKIALIAFILGVIVIAATLP